MIMLSEMSPYADEKLAWAILLHDIGKPKTRTVNEKGIHNYNHERVGAEMVEEILQRLRFPNDFIKTVRRLVANHMRIRVAPKMKTAKLKRLLRDPEIYRLLELNRLDCKSSNRNDYLTAYEYCIQHLALFIQEGSLSPRRLITGSDLINIGHKPGPEFKQALEAVEDAQLAGKIKTHLEALDYVVKWWKRNVEEKDCG